METYSSQPYVCLLNYWVVDGFPMSRCLVFERQLTALGSFFFELTEFVLQGLEKYELNVTRQRIYQRQDFSNVEF